jgi:hypothetical protein
LQDQIVILPESNERRPPRVIPVKNELVHSVDEFVSAIWEHVEQWGIAVAGGYWKPVLHVHVGPGAEARFSELATLLQGSGIEVKRRGR